MGLERKRNVVDKAIKNYGQEITFKRQVFNEFKEPQGEQIVCKVFGFYYRGRSILSIKSNIAGETNTSKEEKLMILIDSNSKDIKKGDTFTLNDNKYKLLDLENAFDLYYDITLERVM